MKEIWLTNGSIHAYFFIVCCRGHQSILKFVCVGGGVICERSVCGVQRAGPLWGLQGDSAPLPEKILYLMGIRCNSIPHFGKNTKLLRKNMVKNHFWNWKNKKTDDLPPPPFSSSKSYDHPFSSWPTPTPYSTGLPIRRNKEQSPKWCFNRNNISINIAHFARGYKALLPIITVSGKSSQSFRFTSGCYWPSAHLIST